jgi:MFS family permease
MTTQITQLKEVSMTDHTQKIRSNLWKMSVVAAANEALFLIPVIVPFFQENGLSLKQVFLLQSIFALSLMVLEIPSGYLSDRWGRKPTMLTGSIVGVLGMLLYSMTTTFWGFFIGEILLAVMVSFYSGTKEAIVYDTLLELGEEKSYRRFLGQQQFAGFSSQAIASVVGGLLTIVALRATVWATLIPFLVGLFVAFFLREPKRHKLQETRHFKAIWDITTHALVKNVPLRSIVILHAVISSLTLTLVWFTQPYQEMVGLPLALFGVTHAFMMIMTGLASKWVHRLEKKADDRLILITIAIIVTISYLSLGFVTSLWGIALLFLGRVMWGFLTPLTSDMVNRMTTSEVRATVLSIRSFGSSLLFGIASPFIGYMADVLTLNQAILATGVVSGVLLTVVFIGMAPVWKQVPK